MKIAFVGAECTGKSTLSAAVAKALNLPHIPDPGALARKRTNYAPPFGMSYGEWFNRWTWQEKWDYEKSMHAAQEELEADLPDFVADSASLLRAACCLTYCSIDCPQQEVMDLWGKALRRSEQSYGVLFYLPLVDNYTDNGNRFMNPNLRVLLNAAILRMLTCLTVVPFYEIAPGDLNFRVTAVLEICDSHEIIR